MSFISLSLGMCMCGWNGKVATHLHTFIHPFRQSISFTDTQCPSTKTFQSFYLSKFSRITRKQATLYHIWVGAVCVYTLANTQWTHKHFSPKSWISLFTIELNLPLQNELSCKIYNMDWSANFGTSFPNILNVQHFKSSLNSHQGEVLKHFGSHFLKISSFRTIKLSNPNCMSCYFCTYNVHSYWVLK